VILEARPLLAFTQQCTTESPKSHPLRFSSVADVPTRSEAQAICRERPRLCQNTAGTLASRAYGQLASIDS
jgi:hypothetical protein